MTPKLKLSEVERKTSLSWIFQPFLPGNWRTMMSMHMNEAPKMQAVWYSQFL
jgi:hypothetical protein